MNNAVVDFLLARIAEDEAPARTAIEHGGNPVHEGGWILKLTGTHVELHVAPGRVLAECNAKRRIIRAWQQTIVPDDDHERGTGGWLLRLLALPYAGHIDYREEWKP